MIIEWREKLASLLNCREHWGARRERTKRQRGNACLRMANALNDLRITGGRLPLLPLRIIITRFGPRPLDTDNLSSSAKAVRDGIADSLGIDDGNPAQATWEYRQEKSRRYLVRVEITGGSRT